MGVAVVARPLIFHFSQSSYSTSKSPLILKTVLNPLPLRRYESTTVKCIAPATSTTTTEKLLSLTVKEIKDKSKTWLWRGYTITYLIYPEEPQSQDKTTSLHHNPLLLVHGFGASIAHWRRNIATLSENHTVFAIDLLGFGASDKPKGFVYSTEIWAELILDFVEEIIQTPTVLIGNSIGSLACLIAAANNRNSLIRALVLLNCAGGMNNKIIIDDWRIKLIFPLFLLIDFLLKQKPIASFIFNRVKSKDSIKSVLMSVYGNKESVDEELVEVISDPANDEGALDAFVAIVTGEPGPNPLQLIPLIAEIPVLVLWGDQDPFTPLDGPVGKYFLSVAEDDQFSKFNLFVLEGVGHCPHDDRPDSVHSKLLPWLENLSIES